VIPLQPPDSHYFRSATGWLEQGNTREAHAELEKITRRLRAHPDVLDLRWQIYAAAKNWDAGVVVAEAVVEQAPDRVAGWLHRAHALRLATGGGLKAAWDALRPAFEKFPDVELIPFNLACYACQMGLLPEARHWLKKSLEIAENTGTLDRLRTRALDDPDLKLLWNEIGSHGH